MEAETMTRFERGAANLTAYKNSGYAGKLIQKMSSFLNQDALKEAAKAFAVSRLVVLGTAYLFFYGYYFATHSQLPPAPPGYLETGQGPLSWHPFNLLFYYDSVHYMSIAKYGYDNSQTLINPLYIGHEKIYLASFFPLYPLLVRIMGASVGAALFLSNLALFAALAAFYQISGKRATWFAAFSPITIIFSSVYAESLFLALTAWGMVFAQKRKFLPCGVFAGLATLTRPAGWAFIAGLFLYIALKKDWKAALLSAAIASSIGLLYPGYLWLKYGDPLLFTHATSIIYHRTLSFPLYGVVSDVKSLFVNGLNLLIIINLLGLILIAYSLSNPWWPYGLVYTLLILSVSSAHPQVVSVVSMLRYAGACASVYLVPRENRLFTSTWITFAILYALMVARKWFVV